MSNTKKSILIYFDNYPMVISLPPEQRGWLFTALMVYGDRLSRDAEVPLEEILEQFPQLSSEARLVCGFMGANIRRDTQRWLSRQQYQSKPIPAKGTPAAPRKCTGPGPASEPTPDQEQKIREDMERTRLLMERLREEG